MKKKTLFGLLALFIAFSCMGVNCQKVMDPAEESSFSQPYDNQNFSTRAECVQWCHDTYQPLLLEENERHQEAMFLCGDDNECKKEANRDHQQNVKRIQNERNLCVRSCHNQGTVGGGF